MAVAGLVTHNWHSANGLMNGTQNEIWHVLNAINLWDATSWVGKDSTGMSYYLWTNYWPPGFYVFSWPFLFLLGATHQSLVLSNLGHLAILLGSVYALGETIRSRRVGLLAMVLVMVYPSVTGNLVRFEPSVALAAWVSLGALCLLKCRGFTDRYWSLGFALATAGGLMMDRLSYAFFLGIPAVIEIWRGLRAGRVAERLVNTGLALFLLLMLCGYWHWNFFQLHLEEVLSQGGAGNIDSAGVYTEQRDPFALRTWLFYVSVLVDDQAGLVPGIAGLLALAAWVIRPAGNDRVLAAVVVSSLLVFSVIQKKQVYYTLPMLGCLAVLTAIWLVDLGKKGRVLTAVLLAAGVHQVGWRLLERPLFPEPLRSWVGEPLLPESWVDRSYPQARPPLWLDLPIDEVLEALPDGEILVLSENPIWTETYATLHLRERMEERRVWQVIGNPQRAVESAHHASALVHIGEGQLAGWPSEELLAELMEQDSPGEQSRWPLAEVLNTAGQRYLRTQVLTWSGGEVAVWVSRAIVEMRD
ncbi:MAG: hypothetical protein VXW32_15115 [Myxococcota bacterium]|nr:hypothetical protein [Myxococcota bacterium]